MGKPVISTASLSCSMGTAPCTYQVLPTNRVTVENQPVANIMDYVPMMNITGFGMCQSPSNPQVAAATAAASGVLTPQPCIPALPAPWTPGSSTVQVGNMPVLNDSSQCMCMWSGSVSVSNAGSTKTEVP